jgi:hypothetical protein
MEGGTRFLEAIDRPDTALRAVRLVRGSLDIRRSAVAQHDDLCSNTSTETHPSA